MTDIKVIFGKSNYLSNFTESHEPDRVDELIGKSLW